MVFSFRPQYAFKVFADISPEFLKGLGVKFLMLDLDNTIASYNEHTPSEACLRWVADMKENDIELFFVSNSRRKTRVDEFADALGIGFLKRAHKPSPSALLQAVESKGFRADESALVGDQIFTDILAANRAGVVSIITKPLLFSNPFLALRYLAELPFRANTHHP